MGAVPHENALTLMDRHDLYELCVQSPRILAAFLHGVHGADPLVLREDFCGTAALSRRWIADGIKRGERRRAVAVDLDPEVLGRAAREAAAAGIADRLMIIQADAADPGEHRGGAGAAALAPDVVFVGNFSIGYIHTRAALLGYLRASRARLAAANSGWGGGVFVCDTYGGAGAFRLGSLERTHVGRRGEVVRYLWRHVAADPLTGIVVSTISFRVIEGGEATLELPDAFIYRWRLWSIAELREAMAEAGFASTEVYTKVDVAPGERPEPVTGPEELGEDWIVCVVGRV